MASELESEHKIEWRALRDRRPVDSQIYRLSDGKVSWEETRNAMGYAACTARVKGLNPVLGETG